MLNHPIEGLMKTTMESLRQVVDVNTIVGDTIETKDGGVIIPVSKVSVGFASGGSEFPANKKVDGQEEKLPFGGGSGGGMSVQPVAFLIINNDQVKLLPVGQYSSVERIVEGLPSIVDDIVAAINKSKKNKDEKKGFDNTIECDNV